MPELPEVEVAARNLRRWGQGRRIRAVWADARATRIFRPANPAATVRRLAGARIDGIRRVGKNLLLTLQGPGASPGTRAGARLAERLARLPARLPIKVALLDQSLLAGVGNIQASEALFRARIDPRRPAATLGRAEVGRLRRGILASIAHTLEALASGDSDIRYVEEDRNDNPFLVYARAGQLCTRCKRAQIERVVQAQRATFYCPYCQRA